MEKIRLKCRFSNDIRTVIVNQNTSISDLKRRLSNDFGFEVALKYEDRDGDLITLSSQDDLSDLLQYATSDSINVIVSESTALPQLNIKGNPNQSSQQKGSNAGGIPVSVSKDSGLPKQGGGVFNVATNPAMSSSTGPSPAAQASRHGQILIPRVERFPNIADSNRYHEQAPAVIRWKRAEMLGQGAFGVVYLGLNIDTGELMAVKQMATEEVSRRELSSLDNEINLLRNLRHPNIVRYIGTELTNSALSIFLEYVPGGSLKALIDKFGALEESVARSYTRQLLIGLEYLHRNGIAHRDIKGANCLVGNDGVIKLADFGNSKHWRPVAATATGGANFTQTGDIKGTPAWMAPEVVKDQGSTISWRKADIWSLGCTTLEMTTGKTPWSQFSNSVTILYHLACQETSPEYPTNPSTELLTFMNMCFQRDPTLRPDATSLLLHPFVAPQATWGQVRPTTMSSLMVHSDGDFHHLHGRAGGNAAHQSMAQFPPRRSAHHNAPVSASQAREPILQPANTTFADNNGLLHQHSHIVPRTAEQPQTARIPSSAENTAILVRGDRVPNTARETAPSSTATIPAIVASASNAPFSYYDANPENTHERAEVYSLDEVRRLDAAILRSLPHSEGPLPITDASLLLASEDRPGTNSLTADDSLNSPMPMMGMLDEGYEGGDRISPSPSPLPISAPVIVSSTPSQRSNKKNNGSARKQGQGRKSINSNITNNNTAAPPMASVDPLLIPPPVSETTNNLTAVVSTSKQSRNKEKASSKSKQTATAVAAPSLPIGGQVQPIPNLEMRQLNKKTANAISANAQQQTNNSGSPSNVPGASGSAIVRKSSPSLKPSPLLREKSASSLVTQSTTTLPSSHMQNHHLVSGSVNMIVPPGSSLQQQQQQTRLMYDSDDGLGGSASSFLAHDTDNDSSMLYADDELGSVDGATDVASLAGDMSMDALPGHNHVYASDSRASSTFQQNLALGSPRLESPRLPSSMAAPNSARVLLNPIDPTSLHQHMVTPTPSGSSGKEKSNSILRPVISLKEPVGNRATVELLSSGSSPTAPATRPTPQQQQQQQMIPSLAVRSIDWQEKEVASHRIDMAPALEVEEEEQVSKQFHSSFGGLGGNKLTNSNNNTNLKGTLSSTHNEIQEDIDGDTYIDFDQDLDNSMMGVNGSLLLESMEKLPLLDISSADPTPIVPSHFRSKDGRKALQKSLELTANDLVDSTIAPAAASSSISYHHGKKDTGGSVPPVLISSPYQRQHKTSGGRTASSAKSAPKDSLSTSGNFVLDANGNIAPAATSTNKSRKASSRRSNAASATNRVTVQTRGGVASDSADNSLLAVNTSDMLDMSCDSLESLHISGINMAAGGANMRSSLQSRQLGPSAATAAMIHGIHQPQPPILTKMKSFSGLSTQEGLDNQNLEHSADVSGVVVTKGTLDTIQPQPLPSVSDLLRNVDPVILDDHQGAVTKLRAPRKAPHMLISGSMDGTVRLWGTTGGQQYDSGADTGWIQRMVLTVDGFSTGAGNTSATNNSSATASGSATAAASNASESNRRVVSLGLKAPSLDEGDAYNGMNNNDNSSLTGSLTGGNNNHTSGSNNKGIKITDVWSEDAAESVWAVCSDGGVRLWSIGHNSAVDHHHNAWQQRPVRIMRGHEDGITCIAGLDTSSSGSGGNGGGGAGFAMSNTTSLAATGSMDRTIRLWDARARKSQVFLFRGHGDTVLSLAWSEEGRALISGSKDRMIKIWDTRAGRLRSTAERHFGSVHTIRALSSSNPAALSGNGGVGLGGGNEILIHPSSSVRGTSAGGVGGMMSSSSNNSNNNAAMAGGSISHYNQENALAFVSVGRDAMINFWNYSGDCISSQTAHRGNTLCMSNISTMSAILGQQTLAFLSNNVHSNWQNASPMPPMLVTAGADSLMKVWDLRRARCAAEILVHPSSNSSSNNGGGNVNKLVWTSPASFVAGFTGGGLRLYEKESSVSTAADASMAASDWQCTELRGQLGSACTDVVTADGYVACSGKNGRILRWRIG